MDLRSVEDALPQGGEQQRQGEQQGGVRGGGPSQAPREQDLKRREAEEPRQQERRAVPAAEAQRPLGVPHPAQQRRARAQAAGPDDAEHRRGQGQPSHGGVVAAPNQDDGGQDERNAVHAGSEPYFKNVSIFAAFFCSSRNFATSLRTARSFIKRAIMSLALSYDCCSAGREPVCLMM